MSLDKILVTMVGTGMIGFIWWFFFGKKEDVGFMGNNIDIVVEGGYKPGTFKVKKGEKVKLNFLRKDSSSCLEEVVIPDFKIKKYLPVGKKVTVEFVPENQGVYGMHCGMNMYHGKIIVE